MHRPEKTIFFSRSLLSWFSRKSCLNSLEKSPTYFIAGWRCIKVWNWTSSLSVATRCKLTEKCKKKSEKRWEMQGGKDKSGIYCSPPGNCSRKKRRGVKKNSKPLFSFFAELWVYCFHGEFSKLFWTVPEGHPNMLPKKTLRRRRFKVTLYCPPPLSFQKDHWSSLASKEYFSLHNRKTALKIKE